MIGSDSLTALLSNCRISHYPRQGQPAVLQRISGHTSRPCIVPEIVTSSILPPPFFPSLRMSALVSQVDDAELSVAPLHTLVIVIDLDATGVRVEPRQRAPARDK